MRSRIFLALFGLTLPLAGCWNSPSTPTSTTSTPTTPAAPNSSPEVAPTTTQASISRPVENLDAQSAETPEEVSRLAVQSLIDAKPEVFWTLLPGSYQERINNLARKSAHRFADDELLSAYASVVRQLADLLQEKKEFLLATPVLPFHTDPTFAQAQWDENVTRLNHLAGSELFQSISLNNFDGGAFCEGPIKDMVAVYNSLVSLPPNDLLGKLQQDLDNAKFEVVSQTDDETILNMTVGDAPAKPYKFVKIEGRWLPAPFVASFENLMRNAEDAVTNYSSDEFEDQKAFLIGQATGVEQYLAELRGIQTQEAFNEQLNRLALQLLPLMLNITPEEEAKPTTDPL